MALVGVSGEAEMKEMIARTPEYISAKVSPDGERVAHVGADSRGVANVFVNGEQVSFFEQPEIIQFFWSGKGDTVLVLREDEGSGALDLFGVRSGEVIQYSEGVNAKLVQVHPEKNLAVIGMNKRNRHFHDLYLLDLDLGTLSLMYENDLYAKFLVNEKLELIGKCKVEEDGSWNVVTKDDALLLHLSVEDTFQSELLCAMGDAVYFLDTRNSDTSQLVRVWDSGEEVLGGGKESDVDEVLFMQGKPVAYATYYVQKSWHAIDEAVEKDLEFLQERVGRNFEVINQSQDGTIWMITCSIPERGKLHWKYEREKGELTQLSSEGNFARMHEMIVQSRDGMNLVCYYTLPRDLGEGPFPLIVVPHGGPFKLRDKYEWNPFHQWLASLGYAVLSVNFRHSSGFGKAFANAGNGEWGGKVHLDVIDAVEKCIEKGIAERGKIACFGGSHGGYESLASLTFTPDYFACCVAICGPSSLKTVLDAVPKFWEFTAAPLSDKLMFFTKKAFIKNMGGDPDTVGGAEYLEKCSPLNYLDQIQAPLLLVHGKNDHVVIESESRQIYESMKAKGKEVTYILFPDEGHRPAKYSNKMKYLTEAENFLGKHLD